MAHQVQVNANEIVLPDGRQYDSGATVTLTDREFSQIRAALFEGGSPVLTDLGEVAGTSGDLSGLGDVIITDPQPHDVVKWDGTHWVNAQPDPDIDFGGGGGGASLADSWLVGYMVGFNDGVGAPVGGGAPFDWSGGNDGPLIVGSDLRLKPGVPTEVEVLTAGDYVINVDVTFRSDVDPTDGIVMMMLDGTFVDAGWGLATTARQEVPVAAFGHQVNYPWTTPPIRLRTNDTIKVLYSPNLAEGAVTALAGFITVKRTA